MHEIGDPGAITGGVPAEPFDLPIRFDAAAELGPPGLVVDYDQAGELVAAAHQVQAESNALDLPGVGPGALDKPPHRRGETTEVQRLGLPDRVAVQVEVVSPEQLLLQLALKGGGDLRVVAEVHQRLVERLGDD